MEVVEKRALTAMVRDTIVRGRLVLRVEDSVRHSARTVVEMGPSQMTVDRGTIGSVRMNSIKRIPIVSTPLAITLVIAVWVLTIVVGLYTHSCLAAFGTLLVCCVVWALFFDPKEED